MNVMWDVPIEDVRAGDVWTSNETRVEVDVVGPNPDPRWRGAIRITGRIIKGYGTSMKVHTWSFWPGHKMDIERKAR
jgi:hypothetical protein